MLSRSLLSCLLLFSLFLLGCGKAKPKAIEVKGSVTLDGKAMADGEVSFVPPGGGIPSVLSVKGGSFSGKATEGKNRVEIRAYKDGAPVMMGTEKFGGGKENYIPAQFNLESKMTADVTASGPNDFSFAVTSK